MKKVLFVLSVSSVFSRFAFPLEVKVSNDEGGQKINTLMVEKKISGGVESERIDAYIAKQVHDITDVYDDVLLELMKRGDEIVESHSCDKKSNSRLLNVYLCKLNQYILRDLWCNLNENSTAFQCVKCISYISTQISVGNYQGYPYDMDKLFKTLTQPFSHCRTLMGMEGSKLILTLIDSNFCKKKYQLQMQRLGVCDDRVKVLEEIYSSNGSKKFWPAISYEFKYLMEDGGQYEVKLINKTGGGQFGGVFEFQGEPKRRFYCKAYWGYPAKGNFNSEKAFASSMSFVRSFDVVDDGIIENEYSLLDFKELFVYKVLEFLDIGPKVNFFKVPVLKDGFFIITEDLSCFDKKFVEMGKINSALETRINGILLDVQSGEVNMDEYKDFNALIGLLELDTVNRIFRLHDSNDGNFGYLAKSQSDSSPIRITKKVASNWLKQSHEFKIVDFIVPFSDSSYVITDIFQTFLDGNSVTRYVKGRLMDVAICRHMDDRDDELIQKNNEEKMFFGEQVIKSLEQRFVSCGNLNGLLAKAKDAVLNFLNTDDVKSEFSEDYMKKGISDLDLYIGGIVENYENLKEQIINRKKY